MSLNAQSTATVSPVKTCRSHQTPPESDRENNGLTLCSAQNCVIEGHYHKRKPAQGANRRLKEQRKKKTSRMPKLCRIIFHVDCSIDGDHHHTSNQKVCPYRAEELQAEIDRRTDLRKRKFCYSSSDSTIPAYSSEDESSTGDSDVDFFAEALNQPIEVKTPNSGDLSDDICAGSDDSSDYLPRDTPEKKTQGHVAPNGDSHHANHWDQMSNRESQRASTCRPMTSDVGTDSDSESQTGILNSPAAGELPSFVEEKKVPFEPVCDIGIVQVPSHQRGADVEPQQFYKVSKAAYQTLRKRFPNPYLCVNFLNSAMACLSKEHQDIYDHQVLCETVRCFISNTYLLQQCCRTPDVISALTQAALLKDPTTRTFIQPTTLDYSDYIRKLGLPVDHGAILRVYGVDSDVPADLTYNGNWEVINSKGFEFSLNPEIPVGVFKTKHNEFPKHYRTQFTRISGLNDFQLLDANGLNVSKAMARLTKSRVNEANLRANQLRILSHLPRVDHNLLAVCSNEPVEIPVEVGDLNGVGDFGTTEVEMAARKRVATYFSNHLGWNPTWKYTLLSFMEGCCFFVLYLFSALAARSNFVTENFVTTKYNPFTFAFKYIPQPSPKRRIYHNWFEQILGLAGHFYSIPVSAKSPEAKFKKELSKPGKHGRLYVTYNESILSIGWIFVYLKDWFCVDHYLPTCSTYHEIPLRLSVRKALDENSVYNSDPPLGLSGQIFSDDMSFQYRHPGGLYLFDADISSCDSGNTVANFYLLATMLRFLGASTNMIRLSYDRLKEAILIRNPSNSQEFLKIKPKTIFQGSGCPETTIVNDVASTSIAISMQTFIAHYNDHPYLSDDKKFIGFFDEAPSHIKNEILQKSALAVGHVITVDEKKTPEELQFLKYSPFQTTDGTFVSTRNLGAILRSLGSCDGDITPIMLGLSKKEFACLSYEEKMEKFMSSVVAGLVNEPKSIIMDALRERFPPRKHKIVSTYHSTAPRNTHTVLIDSYISRYGGTEDEWAQLASQIREFAFGRHLTSPIVAAVMEVDYGLPRA